MRISDWSSDVCSSDLVQASPGHASRDGGPSTGTRQISTMSEGPGPRIGAGLMLVFSLIFPCPSPAVAQGADGSAVLLPPLVVGANRVPTPADRLGSAVTVRSEEHTSKLQSLMRISYA